MIIWIYFRTLEKKQLYETTTKSENSIFNFYSKMSILKLVAKNFLIFFFKYSDFNLIFFVYVFIFKTMNLFRLKVFNGNNLITVLTFLLIGGFLNKCFCKILTNSYLVEFGQNTDRQLADLIARRNGFINVGPVRIIILQFFIFLMFFKQNKSDYLSLKVFF